MDIKITAPALLDLEELRLFLGERSHSGLQNVLTDIETTIVGIPASISRGHKTPHDDVWEKITPIYKYKIPYYSRGDTLYILRVYHSSRKGLDYKAIVNLD